MHRCLGAFASPALVATLLLAVGLGQAARDGGYNQGGRLEAGSRKAGSRHVVHNTTATGNTPASSLGETSLAVGGRATLRHDVGRNRTEAESKADREGIALNRTQAESKADREALALTNLMKVLESEDSADLEAPKLEAKDVLPWFKSKKKKDEEDELDDDFGDIGDEDDGDKKKKGKKDKKDKKKKDDTGEEVEESVEDVVEEDKDKGWKDEEPELGRGRKRKDTHDTDFEGHGVNDTVPPPETGNSIYESILCTLGKDVEPVVALKDIEACIKQLEVIRDGTLEQGGNSWKENNEYVSLLAKLEGRMSAIATPEPFQIAFNSDQKENYDKVKERLSELGEKLPETKKPVGSDKEKAAKSKSKDEDDDEEDD